MATLSNIASFFLITALISFCFGSYPFLKAHLAQYLLEQAWKIQFNNNSFQKQVIIKPWPWADFYPIAKLNFERFKTSQIVLNSDSGQALAFGPGAYQFKVTEKFGGLSGVAVISAHNDTHFSILEKLSLNDKVTLTTRLGKVQTFKVSRFTVMDIKTDELVLLNNDRTFSKNPVINELVLVTCYPFGGTNDKTTLRYIVHLT